MTKKPDHWTETSLTWNDLRGEPLAKAFGWTFWEHPTKGDEHPVLAASLDRIGDHGPVVYDTHDFDVPEYL
jgi:hypothetical protein